VDCHADLATLTEYPHADSLKKVLTDSNRSRTIMVLGKL